MSTAMSASRVGRKPITLPTGVDVKVQDQNILIKGPKGQLTLDLHPQVHVEREGNVLHLKQDSEKGYSRSGIETKLKRSILGTLRARINNVVLGVTHGFEKKLLLVGVGYRAQAKGKILSLSLGFSHPVNFDVPEGVVIETPSQTEIIVKGVDKHLVGQTAAKIRAIRSPEPYKGKGVRYSDEQIILKETKKK